MKQSSKKLKRFCFLLLVDGDLRVSGSFACEENQMQDKMIDMTKKYAARLKKGQDITFFITSGSEEIETSKLVYSDGQQYGCINISKNGGFVPSILKIMENEDNMIIGISQKDLNE